MSPRRKEDPWGWGRVRRRKDGRWQAEIRIAGRRHTKESTKREAIDKWIAEKRGIKIGAVAGVPVERDPQRKTWEDAAESLVEWFKLAEDKQRTEATLTGYRKEIELVVRWWQERCPVICDTRPDDYREWLSAIAEFAPSTRRNRICRFRQLCAEAVRRQWIATAPVLARCPQVRVRDERPAASEATVAALVKAATEPEDRALVMLLALAGLRLHEPCNLLGRDVHDGWLSVLGKGGRRRLTPILFPELGEALDALEVEPDAFVFPTLRKPAGVRGRLGDVWAAARLEGGPQAHQLRHRWITLLAKAGVPALTLRDWAGHTSVTTTEVYYHARARFPAPLLRQVRQRAAAAARKALDVLWGDSRYKSQGIHRGRSQGRVARDRAKS